MMDGDDYDDGDDNDGGDDNGDVPSPELRAAPSHRTGLAFHAAMLKHQVTFVFRHQNTFTCHAQTPCISGPKSKQSENVAVRL